jgi:hypothetical protein
MQIAKNTILWFSAAMFWLIILDGLLGISGSVTMTFDCC